MFRIDAPVPVYMDCQSGQAAEQANKAWTGATALRGPRCFFSRWPLRLSERTIRRPHWITCRIHVRTCNDSGTEESKPRRPLVSVRNARTRGRNFNV